MKKEKGITLITLILTIIVMLILVAVTLNLLTSSGLIERAKQAISLTQEENDKEILLSAVLGAMNNEGKYILSPTR